MYQPYTVHKRPTSKSKRPIYYCHFRDPSGKRLPAVSTGKSTKAKALEWAKERYISGVSGDFTRTRFGEYAYGWFDWETSPFIKRKLKRGEYSKTYAEQQSGLLHNHILPSFSNIPISRINGEIIEDWLLNLAERTSPATANRSLAVLKVIFKEAVRLGHLQVSPASMVE
jgi:hypothetical protein